MPRKPKKSKHTEGENNSEIDLITGKPVFAKKNESKPKHGSSKFCPLIKYKGMNSPCMYWTPSKGECDREIKGNCSYWNKEEYTKWRDSLDLNMEMTE